MYREVFKIVEERGSVYCATVLGGEYAGSKRLYSGNFRRSLGKAPDSYWEALEPFGVSGDVTGKVNCGGVELFVELFRKNPRMVICGGGHVSVPVCHLAKMLGFHVTVMDDREEFVGRERFPEADQLLAIDFQDMNKQIPAYENTCYVVVTRGHSFDLVCARQIMERPYAYFGMIGSRNKVRHTIEQLRRDGYAEERIATMHAPIGLPIGGETPEEIAVSIMAQVIQEKNRYAASYLDERIMDAVAREESGTMLTIIDKKGSSPRGNGSRMWVTKDRQMMGTIGGGIVEYKAYREAGMGADVCVRQYQLSSEKGGETGMICGGTVEVLFENF